MKLREPQSSGERSSVRADTILRIINWLTSMQPLRRHYTASHVRRSRVEVIFSRQNRHLDMCDRPLTHERARIANSNLSLPIRAADDRMLIKKPNLSDCARRQHPHAPSTFMSRSLAEFESLRMPKALAISTAASPLGIDRAAAMISSGASSSMKRTSASRSGTR